MKAYDFVFSNSTQYRLKRHTVFWLFWVVFFTLVYGSKPIGTDIPWLFTIQVSYPLALAEAILYMPCHMLFSYAIMYWLMPRFLFKERYQAFFVGLALVVLMEAFLSHLVTLTGITYARGWFDIAPPASNFYFGLMAGLRGGLSVGGFAAAIKLMKFFYLKQQANQQLESEKLMAELQLLKSQVHPHFLFNTLNNLYSLALTKSDQAPEIVLKLSGLLRYMLYECNTPNVPLARELTLIRNYIELEKLRYGDRLDLSVNIWGDLADKCIAPLLLIPFIENSFKHGASEQLEQAWISLDFSVKGNTLKFKLINGKVDQGVPYSLENDRSERIGLKNVKKRLDLIYPGRYDLKVMDEGETFVVSLTLELENELSIPIAVPAVAMGSPVNV